MNASVPELTDFSAVFVITVPKHVLEGYGPDVTRQGSFAYNCLMARRRQKHLFRQVKAWRMLIAVLTERETAMSADFGKPLLSEVASQLQAFGRGHPIRRLEVFGSVARGDATAASDLDLLVALDESREVTTDELLEMAGEAEELVGRPVNFVIRRSVGQSSNTITKDQILNSAVCIYGT